MAFLERANAKQETAQIIRIGIDEWSHSDFTVLTGTASAGRFARNSPATGRLRLDTEDANNNSKTATCRTRFRVPQNYVEGANLSLIVRCSTNSTVVGSSATIDASAYRSNEQDGASADLVATAGATLTNDGSNQEFTFTITGTTIDPGDEIDIYLTAVIDDTGGSASVPLSITSTKISTTTQM